jgi:ABC-2 type transport system ATP-binding protein
VAGRTEVKWSVGGEHFVHAADDGTAFVRQLFAQHGDRIEDLEVRRATLEDTYMALVHLHENDEPDTALDGAPEARFGGAA